MRNVFLLICFLFLISSVVKSQTPVMLPSQSIELIQQVLNEEIYFEDDGYKRMITDMNKFSFNLLDSNLLEVSGKFYSQWDDKELTLSCLIEVTTRGLMTKRKDLRIESCVLDNENWPYYN